MNIWDKMKSYLIGFEAQGGGRKKEIGIARELCFWSQPPLLVWWCDVCCFVDMLNKQDCKYADNCTFAYHQEEIDVWTEERKGTLNRDLLFDPLGGVKRGSLTIAKILKEHQGIFTFLCEVRRRSIRCLSTVFLYLSVPTMYLGFWSVLPRIQCDACLMLYWIWNKRSKGHTVNWLQVFLMATLWNCSLIRLLPISSLSLFSLQK